MRRGAAGAAVTGAAVAGAAVGAVVADPDVVQAEATMARTAAAAITRRIGALDLVIELLQCVGTLLNQARRQIR